MKLLLVLVPCLAFMASVNSQTHKLVCQLAPPDIPRDWITMVDPCVEKMTAQVQEELTAAMTYLAMGAHFSRDSINRPGFAKFFFESASEEREHAIKIISYLLMRGELTEDVRTLIQNPKPNKDTWPDGVTALRDALKLEAYVTNKIRDIIITCETPPPSADNIVFNDYHLVDHLTGDFLEEQYRGQRHLAGMISTLGKMMDHHGPLGEFLYDKKILHGDLF